MTLSALMNQEVTLRTPSGGSQDSIGELTQTYTELATTMYLEPVSASRGGTEDMANRNTVIGEWLGLGRTTIDWTPWQQIVYGSHLFDIVAPPRPEYIPRTQTLSHYELKLQEVI